MPSVPVPSGLSPHSYQLQLRLHNKKYKQTENSARMHFIEGDNNCRMYVRENNSSTAAAEAAAVWSRLRLQAPPDHTNRTDYLSRKSRHWHNNPQNHSQRARVCGGRASGQQRRDVKTRSGVLGKSVRNRRERNASVMSGGDWAERKWGGRRTATVYSISMLWYGFEIG